MNNAEVIQAAIDIAKTVVGWLGAGVVAVVGATWLIFDRIYASRLAGRDEEIAKLKEELARSKVTPSEAQATIESYRHLSEKEVSQLKAELETARKMGDQKVLEEKQLALAKQEEASKKIAILEAQVQEWKKAWQDSESAKNRVGTEEVDVTPYLGRPVIKIPGSKDFQTGFFKLLDQIDLKDFKFINPADRDLSKKKSE
jgi:hypothetical protein